MPEPWVLHEDDDLLVVDKPAGVPTHRSDALGQEGAHEWTSARRPGELSVLHRLDKETSGALLFGRSTRANRALGAQLSAAARGAGDARPAKRYLLLCEVAPGRAARLSSDARVPRPKEPDHPGDPAATDLERLERGAGVELWEARPHTGRTHQVRVHAAQLGLPLLGDERYGGRAAARLFLHAASLQVERPDGGGTLEVESPLPIAFRRALAGEPPDSPRLCALAAHEARARLFEPRDTDAWLWIDRHHDGFADLRVERLGPLALVVRHDDAPGPLPRATLDALLDHAPTVWAQRRPRRGQGGPAERLAGDVGPRLVVREHGLAFQLDLTASPTSTGLFLDQRETRRRLLGRDLRGKTLLNAFAHTGALSVAAAKAGAVTTSLDLSKRYLEWARENLALNALDPATHDFIYGDALDWMRRLEKKGRRFDLVLVDPPSFSKGKQGTWSVERDLPALVERAARLCARGGTLYVSTNLRRLPAEHFLAMLEDGLRAAGRWGAVEPATLPIDHRSGPGDPPYLKAAWVALDA